MHIATVSSKQQVTLPKALLMYLGVGKGGKVIFEPRGKETLLVKPMKKSIVEQTAGSLNKYIKDKSKLGRSWEEIWKEASEAYTQYLGAQDQKTKTYG